MRSDEKAKRESEGRERKRARREVRCVGVVGEVSGCVVGKNR